MEFAVFGFFYTPQILLTEYDRRKLSIALGRWFRLHNLTIIVAEWADDSLDNFTDYRNQHIELTYEFTRVVHKRYRYHCFYDYFGI